MTGGEPVVLIVPPELARTRLDRVVATLLVRAMPGEHASRAAVQRWIDEGRVRVDGEVGRAASAVASGARIEVIPGRAQITDVVPDASVVFQVLFEDAHLIVLDKPAGLVVHPARGHEEGTLVHGLLARGGFSLPAGEGDDLLRPGIVHRLDKGTSGVMVVAKDEFTREGLKKLFATHDIERSYVAITVGKTVTQTIASSHGRHPTDRLRFTTRIGTGKRAVTHVELVESLGPCSLVRCRLETGRTHQIRVHLAEVAGTPVLGDPVYGGRPKDLGVRAMGEALGRQALHAEVLGFVHPRTGERLRFETAVPPDMAKALAELRHAASILEREPTAKTRRSPRK